MVAKDLADHIRMGQPFCICDACLALALGRPVTLIASIAEALANGPDMLRAAAVCDGCQRPADVTRLADAACPSTAIG